MVYLDSSALVKLVVVERESRALRRYLRRHPHRVSSALARTEVVRAVRHYGLPAVRRARTLLRRVDLVCIDDDLLDAAATLDPQILRSLDAIHLAAALLFSGSLVAVVTYDGRMKDSARMLGLSVEAPS